VTAALPASYGRYVIISIALASAITFILAGLTWWAAHLVHVGNLDAHALAEKAASSAPASALDWPELHVHAVVPELGEQPVVLLHVGWPAHPRCETVLLLALDHGDSRSLSLLAQWCATAASVSPARCGGTELELRRRQSLDRVHAFLIAEDSGHMQIA
jgi:hypothetical protein